MTLSEWADLHRDDLGAEPPDKDAIAELRQVAEREVRDAETVESYDGRLGHAHTACLAVAAAALAATGYRVRQGSMAHHWRLIESLEHTLGLTPGQVKLLQDYRKKRSRSVYERAGIVTGTEAGAALATARDLRDRLAGWLAQQHPDLLPK
jgi:hypothetical protein